MSKRRWITGVLHAVGRVLAHSVTCGTGRFGGFGCGHAQYLQDCLEDAPGDTVLFAKALGDVARARGMMQLVRDTGMSREGLYKALGENGNPSFATVMKVLSALGLKFHVEPQTAHV